MKKLKLKNLILNHITNNVIYISKQTLSKSLVLLVKIVNLKVGEAYVKYGELIKLILRLNNKYTRDTTLFY